MMQGGLMNRVYRSRLRRIVAALVFVCLASRDSSAVYASLSARQAFIGGVAVGFGAYAALVYWDMRMNTAALKKSTKPLAVCRNSTDEKLDDNWAKLCFDKSLSYVCGVAQLQGRRPTQEDRYCVQRVCGSLLFAGVFDGHGGPSAATMAACHLYKFFPEHYGSYNKDCTIQFAFAYTQESIRALVKDGSGTTAVVAFRHGDSLTIAHMGDSRAYVVSRKQNKIYTTQKLTQDHNINNMAERARAMRYVNSSMAMPNGTRMPRIMCLGGGICAIIPDGPDSWGQHTVVPLRSLHNYRFQAPYMLTIPEVAVHKIQEDDYYCVLASDGLGLTPEQISAECDAGQSCDDIAQRLVDRVKSCVSDNVTALVIDLHKPVLLT